MNKKMRAFIYIILAGVLWGTSGIFVNILAPYGFSSLQMTAMRAVVSSAALAMYILISNRQLFKTTGRELILFAASGLGLFGTASCYYSAMQKTSIATAVVLMYTAPVIVMIYSVLFFGEKLTRLKAVSVASMLVGCALVSGIIGGMEFDALGIAIAFLSGISYSAYNIFTKMEMRHKSKPLTATFYCFVFMMLICLAVSNPVEIISLSAVKPGLIVPVIIALGILTGVMPYFLYTLALKELPAGTTSALAIIEPMSATVFGIVLFNERLTVQSLCGIILILGAVFLLSRSEK